jgi:hypothetical protein
MMGEQVEVVVVGSAIGKCGETLRATRDSRWMDLMEWNKWTPV